MPIAGTLAKKLIPRLLARFPDRGLRVHQGTQPAASFPAAHPEVGDLLIDDDGDELTISVGELTHGHFSPRSYEKPPEEWQEQIIGDVIEFLDEVFRDEVEFSSAGAGKMGGWQTRGKHHPIARRPEVRNYVWSGPLGRT
jgi:hypothetical protein